MNIENFTAAIKRIFVGTKIEGKSGYVNIMKKKEEYLDRALSLRKLEKEIHGFPNFEEKYLKKVKNFFQSNFNESGSLCIKENVLNGEQESVFSPILNEFFYVKSDILPKNSKVLQDGMTFIFDVSKLQHKKSWEKRTFSYELKEVKNGEILLWVLRSERDLVTPLDKILEKLDKNGIKISERNLKNVFSNFERQTEVDYFICKDAKNYLQTRLDNWLLHEFYSAYTSLDKLQSEEFSLLRKFCHDLIGVVAKFEVKKLGIWQKPKSSVKVGYVITLDKIESTKNGQDILRKLLENANFRSQVKEWEDLGIIPNDFNKNEILLDVKEGLKVRAEHRFLPIDTYHFKDLEVEILELFEDLDDALDGWLVKSENWQALNTLMREPKFRHAVRVIYIDPPYNTGSNDATMYVNRFRENTWVTMISNRLDVARDLLTPDGSMYVRIDYHGNHYVRMLMDRIFGKENFRNEIMLRRTKKVFEGARRFIAANDSLFFYSNSEQILFNIVKKERKKQKWIAAHSPGVRWSKVDDEYLNFYAPDQLILKEGENRSRGRVYHDHAYIPPEGRHWTFTQKRLEKYDEQGRIKLDKNGMLKYLTSPLETVDSNWTDIPGYVVPYKWGFPTENSEQLLQRIIEASSKMGDVVLDYFLGCGTTTAVAHKLGRKWIGIEMEDYFHTIVLPRMKEVLAGRGSHEPSGISRQVGWKGGGFFKYFELEQYEDSLNQLKNH